MPARREYIVHRSGDTDETTISAISDVVASVIMERVDIANATGTEVSLDLPTSTARLVIERYPQAAGHIKSSLIHRFSERIKNILDAYDPPAQQVDRIASRTTETLGALSIFMFMDYMQDGLVNLFGLFS